MKVISLEEGCELGCLRGDCPHRPLPPSSGSFRDGRYTNVHCKSHRRVPLCTILQFLPITQNKTQFFFYQALQSQAASGPCLPQPPFLSSSQYFCLHSNVKYSRLVQPLDTLHLLFIFWSFLPDSSPLASAHHSGLSLNIPSSEKSSLTAPAKETLFVHLIALFYQFSTALITTLHFRVYLRIKFLLQLKWQLRARTLLVLFSSAFLAFEVMWAKGQGGAPCAFINESILPFSHPTSMADKINQLSCSFHCIFQH